MKGKKVSDETVNKARELRATGLSVRDIGKQLHVSKSSIDRFTRGIAVEEIPQPQREAAAQTEDRGEAFWRELAAGVRNYELQLQDWTRTSHVQPCSEDSLSRILRVWNARSKTR